MSTHRRRFLRLCGVAGLGAVAGCSGGSEDGGTPTDDETPADSETTTQSPTATLTPTPMTAETATPTETQTPTETETPTDTETPTETTGSPEQAAKVVADDGDSEDGFGVSVAVSSDGTTALIGAWGDEDPNGADPSTNSGAGSAYVFENSGGSWTQQAKLAADDGDGADAFGTSVSLSHDGTTALIGAYFDEDPNGGVAGSAYVFEHSGGSWSQQDKLAADDGDSYDNFGTVVDLSNDGTTALIGADGDEDPNGTSAGSAYIFENSGGSWTQQAKLASDDGDRQDNFGSAVELSDDGTTALIGARFDDHSGNDGGSADTFENVGSAYVFENSGSSWTQQAKLTADDGDGDDNFGMSVAMSSDGTTVLIGARTDEDPNGAKQIDVGETQISAGAGSAYVFDNSGGSWTQQAKFAADDGDGADDFGSAATLSSDGTTALIGANGDEDPNGKKAGSAYVFDNSDDNWTQRSKLVADDGDPYDWFGTAVAMSGDSTDALIGAPFIPPFDYSGDEGPGSAYAFDL